jgi:hypothetical protein
MVWNFNTLTNKEVLTGSIVKVCKILSVISKVIARQEVNLPFQLSYCPPLYF